MNQYRLPVLTTSFIINILAGLFLFNPIFTLIGILIFAAVGAGLHYYKVSEDDMLNTLTLVSLTISLLLVGGFLLTYLSLFLVLVGIGGLIWYIFKKPEGTNFNLFK